MNENAEMGYVLNASVSGTAMLIKGSAVMVQELIKFLQWAQKRLAAGKLKPEEYENIEKFIRHTGGNVSYLSVPFGKETEIEKIKENLEKMKVPFCVLPDLDTGDNMLQIMYPTQSKEVIQPWFEQYCLERLKRPESLDAQTLTALAGGEAKTGIMTVPIENENLLEEMKEDFKTMAIAYNLLPLTKADDKGVREVLFVKKDQEKIMHWLENFCQKHVVPGDEKTYQELQAIAGNKGQIGFINIPREANDRLLSTMKEDFKKYGINYHIMDDMRTGDGFMQVMYLKKDEAAVRNWYSNFATDRLTKGGEYTYSDLMNLTAGKTQMAVIPIKGEGLSDLKADFDSLHINYTELPALKANEDHTIMMYAAADSEKVRSWYGLYQERIMHETGEKLPEMESVTMEEYMKEADISVDDYLATEPEKQKMEAEEALNQTVGTNTKKNVPLHENAEYKRLTATPGMKKITINKSLVTTQENGTFISAVPGTKREKFLVLSSSSVFKSDFVPGTDNNKTYIAFLPENSRHMIVDTSGNPLQGMSTEEVLQHYDPVNRDFAHQKIADVNKSKKETSGNIKFSHGKK